MDVSGLYPIFGCSVISIELDGKVVHCTRSKMINNALKFAPMRVLVDRSLSARLSKRKESKDEKANNQEKHPIVGHRVSVTHRALSPIPIWTKLTSFGLIEISVSRVLRVAFSQPFPFVILRLIFYLLPSNHSPLNSPFLSPPLHSFHNPPRCRSLRAHWLSVDASSHPSPPSSRPPRMRPRAPPMPRLTTTTLPPHARPTPSSQTRCNPRCSPSECGSARQWPRDTRRRWRSKRKRHWPRKSHPRLLSPKPTPAATPMPSWRPLQGLLDLRTTSSPMTEMLFLCHRAAKNLSTHRSLWRVL